MEGCQDHSKPYFLSLGLFLLELFSWGLRLYHQSFLSHKSALRRQLYSPPSRSRLIFGSGSTRSRRTSTTSSASTRTASIEWPGLLLFKLLDSSSGYTWPITTLKIKLWYSLTSVAWTTMMTSANIQPSLGTQCAPVEEEELPSAAS